MFHVVSGRPTGAIAFNFGVRSDIADIMTHAKFYVNRFRGFGVLTPPLPILPFSIGWTGRPYNSVSSATMLQCDVKAIASLLRIFKKIGSTKKPKRITCLLRAPTFSQRHMDVYMCSRDIVIYSKYTRSLFSDFGVIGR